MRRLTPRVKTLIVLLLILIPLGILGLALNVTFERQREATERLRHARDIVSLAGTLEGRLADMHLHLDGIILYGEDERAKELERDYIAFLLGIRSLRKLVGEAEAGQLGAIEERVRAWRQRVVPESLRVSRAVTQAEVIWLSRSLRTQIADLRQQLSEFLRAQEHSLRERAVSQDDLQHRVIVEGSLAVLAIGLAGGLLLLQERTRAKRSLVESQERYRILFEEAPIAYHEIDTTGIVRRVNRAECDLLGYPPDQLVDRPVWDTVAPEVRETARAAVKRKLAGEQPLAPFEREVLRKDGARLTVEIHENLIRDAAGRVAGIRSALLNVTERRRAEVRLRLQGAALASAANAIVITDREGRIVWVNPAFSRLTGYTPEEVQGRNPRTLKSDRHGAEFYRAMWQRILAGEVWQGELINRRKDGSLYPEEMTITPVLDGAGEITHFIAIKQDITERKSVERMKDEFVSVVSHELRTPLTSIRGALGLLAGGLLGPVSERGQRMLDIAVANTDRLVRLINDILDIERMESGRVVMNKRACQLADLVAQAVEVMRPMAEHAGVTLVPAPFAARLWADPDRLLQVFTNLLSNAIKFSPAGSEVRLDGDLEEGWALVRVRDRGRGIPADKLESIFERFQQVDASDSREKGGTGLGLAICRSIVSQHDGQIRAESVPGEGSTFSVRLPVLRGPSAAPAPLPAPAGRTVLVCEEEPEIRRDIREILERGGYAVLEVQTPQEAVRVAREGRPATVLLGRLAADREGWTTLGLLKADADSREIPVVLLSSEGAAERPVRSSDRIAGRIPRPPEAGSLLEMLQRVGAARVLEVVVVEDDADLAQILLTIFQRCGTAVRHAASGREAIRLCRESPPDLIVLDVGLPEGDGFAVVEGLRDDRRLRAVPLVVYTAQDLSEADRRRLTLGQTEFLTKSRIPSEEFERQIVRLLRGIAPERHPRIEERGDDREADPAGG